MRLTALLFFISLAATAQDTVYHRFDVKSRVYRPGEIIPASAVNRLEDVEIPPGKSYQLVEVVVDPVTIQAVNYAQGQGITKAADYIGSTDAGDYVTYPVNLSGRLKVQVEYSRQWTAEGSAEVREGSLTGRLLGTIRTPNTGGWTTYATTEADLLPSVASVVYIVFKTEGTGNIKSFIFK